MNEPPASTNAIRIELVSSLNALAAHRDAYHDLLDEAIPGRGFFYRLEGLRALEPIHASGRRSPFFLLAWQGAALVGALPLVLERKAWTRAGVRRLRLWGGDGTLVGVEGEVPLRGAASDRALVASAWRDALTGPLGNRFDELELGYLRGDSASLPTLQSAFRDGTWSDEPLVSHVVELSTGEAQWRATRSHDRMRRIRSLRKRLEARGPVSVVERARLASDEFERIMALHESRQDTLSARGKPRESPFADRARRDALIALLAVAAEQGRARHRLLFVGEELVAFRLAFVEGTTMLAFMTAMHDGYADCSPGSILLQEVIEREFALGELQRIELGAGTTFLKETMATQAIVPRRLTWQPPNRPLSRARLAVWRGLVKLRQRVS